MVGPLEILWIIGVIFAGLFLMRSGVGDTYAGSIIGAIMAAFWPVTALLAVLVILEYKKPTNKS